MMNLEGLENYLKNSGLNDRIEHLKPGDSFGVELPIDEDNNKWLRFWLSTEGEGETVEYVTVDFEGFVRMRVCCDEKKLTDWMNSSGLMDLISLAESIPEETEQKE